MQKGNKSPLLINMLIFIKIAKFVNNYAYLIFHEKSFSMYK